MHRLSINFNSKETAVFISKETFDVVPRLIRKITPANTSICIITDSNVADLYLRVFQKNLKNTFRKTTSIVIPAGESSKNLSTAEKIFETLVKKNIDRGSLIICLGGGVIGDIGGFVASNFMRGIRYVQIPTTLLAQVDSCIGGKVAVNLKYGKNLVGSFYQPDLIFITPIFLKTLPKKEFANGLAEIIKYALISSNSLFIELSKFKDEILNLNMDVLKKIILQCVKIKIRVVKKDEKEKHLRRILNFGHTIGHAIESASNYKIFTHGEAVSIGIVAESFVSYSMNLISHSDFVSIINLLQSFDLPVNINGKKIDFNKIINFIKSDKKIFHGKLYIPILKRIGCVEISDNFDYNLIKKAVKFIT